MTTLTPLWSPSQERIKNSRSSQFISTLARNGVQLTDFHSLYKWSVDYPERFWSALWDFAEVIGEKGPLPHICNGDSLIDAQWFPEAQLNFTENLLRSHGTGTALTFYGEEKIVRRVSWDDLRAETQKVAQYLKECGVQSGDVVAGLLPNMPEAVIGMLASASLGATWTSCSPDFGANGIIDRFGQTTPKVLITSDGYFYRDSIFSLTDKLADILGAIPSIQNLLITNYTGSPLPLTQVKVTRWNSLPSQSTPLTFERTHFSHPLYILYSSGTTGKPKCIKHSVGGTLLEHLKEHMLHVDLRSTDTITYQTTCGWMMWNWLVSALAVGAHVVLYDGYPFSRGGNILLDIIDAEKISVFGTNAKFIASLEKEKLIPRSTHSLDSLHTILSTGSPLLPENFDYIYREVKSDVCLSSISGGTDILGCFALGSPTLPVYRGELQTRSLGLNVQVWSEEGKALVEERGELVCTAPFPSQPIGFWDDPQKERYSAAYYSRFPNIWHHGDYVELTQRGGMIFYGRSDTVLNPGGIRIGTAEIYRQVEQFSEIQESIVVGQEWDNDVRVVLFVKVALGVVLDDALRDRIRRHIKKHASPFHVPKKIIEVADIPKTRSGKITETAVRDVIHGKAVKNTEALLNPESLEFFRDLTDLKT